MLRSVLMFFEFNLARAERWFLLRLERLCHLLLLAQVVLLLQHELF